MKLYSHRSVLIFAALMIGGTIVAKSAFAKPQEKLIITGTGSSIGVMKRMAGGFQKRYPNVTVSVPPSIGSTGGIKAVREGEDRYCLVRPFPQAGGEDSGNHRGVLRPDGLYLRGAGVKPNRRAQPKRDRRDIHGKAQDLA